MGGGAVVAILAAKREKSWYLSEINYVDYHETRERRTRMALMIVLLLALAAGILAIVIGRG